jgi:hypothetical protein
MTTTRNTGLFEKLGSSYEFKSGKDWSANNEALTWAQDKNVHHKLYKVDYVLCNCENAKSPTFLKYFH